MPGPTEPEAWHAWFTQQAGWTQSTRRWLYREARLGQARDILEVGCGTGVIAEELARTTAACVVGLDIDPAMLSFTTQRGNRVTYVQGDAHVLPFPGKSFDAVVSHYLLLWLDDPVQGVREMARVIRPSGRVLACAEPDYGGRIDHPPELAALGRRQTEALREQGADPEIGRRLGEIFAAAGLRAVVGTMAGQWIIPTKPNTEFEAEWAMRERDLNDILPPEELRRLRAIDRQALEEGRRVLFVPTFYALGRISD
ncbi:MAG: methyltransferase domain-containing protein [Anaerolineae bacterium]|nr:methyltransferase domain-containing protein [Anaerolineae bacterium]